MSVKAIPDGFGTVTPYLVVEDVSRLIVFLEAGLQATETERSLGDDGRIMHAQVRIGDSMVMMGGAMPGHPAQTTTLYIYLPDVDAAYRRGVAAGGVSLQEPMDMPYGDRCGGFRDPAGNSWWVATHIEDVPMAEITRRMREMSKMRKA